MKLFFLKIWKKFKANFLNFQEAYRSPGTLLMILLLEIAAVAILAFAARFLMSKWTIWARILTEIAP